MRRNGNLDVEVAYLHKQLEGHRQENECLAHLVEGIIGKRPTVPGPYGLSLISAFVP